MQLPANLDSKLPWFAFNYSYPIAAAAITQLIVNTVPGRQFELFIRDVMHESGRERKKEIMPTGPLSSAKATNLYRAGLGKLQISQGTAFQPSSSKNPPLR